MEGIEQKTWSKREIWKGVRRVNKWKVKEGEHAREIWDVRNEQTQRMMKRKRGDKEERGADEPQTRGKLHLWIAMLIRQLEEVDGVSQGGFL